MKPLLRSKTLEEEVCGGAVSKMVSPIGPIWVRRILQKKSLHPLEVFEPSKAEVHSLTFEPRLGSLGGLQV